MEQSQTNGKTRSLFDEVLPNVMNFYGIVMNYKRFAPHPGKTVILVADWASPTWSPWWWYDDDDSFVLDHLVMNDAADVAPPQS
jgi:hypothetical protein